MLLCCWQCSTPELNTESWSLWASSSLGPDHPSGWWSKECTTLSCLLLLLHMPNDLHTYRVNCFGSQCGPVFSLVCTPALDLEARKNCDVRFPFSENWIKLVTCDLRMCSIAFGRKNDLSILVKQPRHSYRYGSFPSCRSKETANSSCRWKISYSSKLSPLSNSPLSNFLWYSLQDDDGSASSRPESPPSRFVPSGEILIRRCPLFAASDREDPRLLRWSYLSPAPRFLSCCLYHLSPLSMLQVDSTLTLV